MKNNGFGFNSYSTELTRRRFLVSLGAAGVAFPFLMSGFAYGKEKIIKPNGPGAQYAPVVNAAFVRRKGDYGMLWPGAIYDGKKALQQYKNDILNTEKELGIKINLREEPIYSLAEAEGWIMEAKSANVDGLLVVLLDRQSHSWPTAGLAAASGIPSIVFSPIGTSFTTNTAPVSKNDGVFIVSTSDFSQAKFGLKMLKAGAKLRRMRFVVIRGNKRYDTQVEYFGTNLRCIPAGLFIEEYNNVPVDEEINHLATEYIRAARRVSGATRQDVINGIKSYVVARNILQREEADGITMDCLGALGKTKISLPCIAWSKMNDCAIPAVGEADIGAAITHAIVQYLFDRPGFQQDPVAETNQDCLIGAHCSCPTRLRGFDQKPEPFDIMHHHGNRDAVPRTIWRKGERVTIADVLLPGENRSKEAVQSKPQMVIGVGTVVDNVSVPPAGGCVVSVMVRLDTRPDLLTYPGFHQLFFYGDFKKELLAFCKLFGIQPVVA